MSPSRRTWSQRPFPVRKVEQLWGQVRASHEQPMTGRPKLVRLVRPNELGVTFIGHSSFLLQISGRNVLVDPVFSKRLILLRRQRRAGILVKDLPPIDLVLLTHAHMDHLDMASLRRVIRATRRLTGEIPEVVIPTGVEDLVARLGFSKVHQLAWWEQTQAKGLKVTMTPCKHWGARMFRDIHRGYGGYVVEGRGPDGIPLRRHRLLRWLPRDRRATASADCPFAYRGLFSRCLPVRTHQPRRSCACLRGGWRRADGADALRDLPAWP